MPPDALPPALVALGFAWTALLGACLGSFLNVVIARVPVGQSVVSPGSRCPRCGMAIRWYDNVPVLSWVLLRARCRGCRAPISARYPLVELAGAGLALSAYARHGFTPAAGAELAFTLLLLALALIDLDTWLLPNALTWPVIVLGLLAGAAGWTLAGGLKSAAYGAGIGFAAFALVAWAGERVFKKEAMGFGDVWLLAGLGAWLGPLALLPVVLLASVQGTVVGIALILLGRGQPGPERVPPARSAPTPSPPAPLPHAGGEGRGEDERDAAEDDWVPPRHAVPFGPFLVAGALEWLWGAELLARWVPLLEIFK